MGNPVSSDEEHGDIDTAYKYRLPNGLLDGGRGTSVQRGHMRAVLFMLNF